MGDFLYPFRILLRAFHEYKWKIVLLAALGFFSSTLAGIGIGAVIPLLSFFIGGGAPIEGAASTQSVMKYFEYLPFSLTPVSTLAVIVSIFFLRSGVLFLLNAISVRVRAEYRRSVKTRVLGGFLGASWPFFSKQRLGHVTETLMRDVDVTSKLLDDAVNILLSFSNILVLSALSFLISPRITFFAFFLGTAAFMFFQKIYRKGKELGQAQMVLGKETAQLIAEHMIGAKTVKSLAVEDAVLRRGTGYFEKGEGLAFKSGILMAVYSVSTEPLTIVFIAGVFLFSYFTSGFDLGIFAALLIFLQRIFVYFGSSQLSFHVINEKIPSAVHLLEFEKSIADYGEKPGGKIPFSFDDKFSFENISFGYSSGAPVLSELSFSVSKGEMAGIVGPSGSGKTTLADIFMRLIEPSGGLLLLDGKEVREYDLRSWRENIGYVAQEPFLLNDTIATNIGFYKEKMSDDVIAGAAKKAQIYDFIQSLPKKFNTTVGDRGVMLSGGQRQRIALARVLARNPQILILDEATSALDNESESLIQKAIRDLKGKVTIVVIAHRLSTVVDLDRILVLDKGKIVEKGGPQELLQDKNSYFYRMYHLKEN